MTRIANQLDQLFTQATQDEDVTPTQARLMRIIYDPIPQQALATQLGIDAPRTSQLTRDLENKGYLRRVQSEGDRRVRRSELTQQGEAVLGRISNRLVATSPLPDALPASEMQELLGLLTLVESRIQRKS